MSAQSIGLHRKSPVHFDLNEEDVRLRTQLWWVIYHLDARVYYYLTGRTLTKSIRTLSLTQGRPTPVSGQTAGAQLLPLYKDNSPSSSLGTTSASSLYILNTKLAHIQHRFCNVTYQGSSTAAKLDELAAIDAALMSWCNEVPIECRPG